MTTPLEWIADIAPTIDADNSTDDSNSSQYLVMYEKLLKARVPNFYMNRGN